MNTFSTAWLRIPAGGKIVVKGEFPHMRRWSFTAYPENGAPRDAEPRRYTFSIASGAPPEHRPANTVYTLAEPGTAIGMHMRNYVPDRSVDWVGGFALQEVELHDDGRALKDEEPGAATQEPLRGKQAPLAVAPRLCQALPRVPWVDRETAPATPFEAAPM